MLTITGDEFQFPRRIQSRDAEAPELTIAIVNLIRIDYGDTRQLAERSKLRTSSITLVRDNQTGKKG